MRRRRTTTVAVTAAGSNEPRASAIASEPAHSPAATAPRKRRPLFGGAGLAHRGHELGDGREQRSGRDDAADLLGEDAGFDHAEPDAAVGLGDGQRRPAQAGQRRPERVGPHAVVDDLTGERRPGSPGEHRADRVAQLVLIGGEFELHGLPPR